ncbi:MAG: hypothetical protein ACPG43_09870, partial [Alcanivoracaceae bacterium]
RIIFISISVIITIRTSTKHCLSWRSWAKIIFICNTIANRTVAKAEELAEQFSDRGIAVYGTGMDTLRGPFDIIINAISAGLAGDMPALPDGLIGADTVCYDMVYGNPAEKSGTPFLAWAETHGATEWADGIGMLVEQAAESFYLWMNWRPDSKAVIRALRHPSAGD